MKNLPRIILESFRQALQSLIANKLRSFLSLLGISIGIFCIIGVLSAVDSLKENISASFDALGKDVLYVHRFSWTEDPGQNYWKWMKHPQTTIKDHRAIKEQVQSARLVGLFSNLGRKTAKYRSNSVDGAELSGIMEDNGELMGLRYEAGRYFSTMEMRTGANKVILGKVVAEELFVSIPPIGKKIKVGSRKLEVIGVLEKAGESLINFLDFDKSILIPYQLAKKYANLGEGHNYG
ncbi:MAG: ABC transporter permease, partial [Bacteroidota bacterium]